MRGYAVLHEALLFNQKMVNLYRMMYISRHNYIKMYHVPRAANGGGGNWGILPWTPHLQGAPSYKQHYMRLKILTSTFCK